MCLTELCHEIEKPVGCVPYLVASDWRASFSMTRVALVLVSLDSLRWTLLTQFL
jgi:hypothetical protein